MKTLEYIVFGVVLVLILYLIYCSFFAEKSADNEIKTRVHKSAGGFDKEAQEAFRLAGRNNRARDHHIRGMIIGHNIINAHLGGVIGPGDGELLNAAVVEMRQALAMDTTRDEARAIADWTEGLLMGDTAEPGRFVTLLDIGNYDLGDDFEANIFQPLAALNHMAVGALETANAKTVADRLADAALEPTRAEAQEKFFEPEFTPNPQSVHDNLANKDLNRTLEAYQSSMTYTGRHHADTEIRRWVVGADITPENVAKALQILDLMTQNELVATYGRKEQDILDVVWSRCYNDTVTDEELAKEAVVLALADSMEATGPVCVGGRAARVINSLATIDDAAEKGALTFTAYKNQIFDETKNIIQETLDSYEKSGSSADRVFAKAYKAGDPTDADVEAQFIEEAKQKIIGNIDSYDNLSDRDKTTLRAECLAALTL